MPLSGGGNPRGGWGPELRGERRVRIVRVPPRDNVKRKAAAGRGEHPSAALEKAKEQEPLDWAGLPWEVLTVVYAKLGPAHVLRSAQGVCRNWRGLARDPRVWKVVDFRGTNWDSILWRYRYDESVLVRMAAAAIDRSAGRMEELSLVWFPDDGLLKRIARRATRLKCLRLITCCRVSERVLASMLEKLPLLETLEISLGYISKVVLETAGRSCPLLQRLHIMGCHNPDGNGNGEAYAIAKTMPKLQELHMAGNHLTNKALIGILKACPHLKSLDLRMCDNINFDRILKKKCKGIPNLKLPENLMLGHPYCFEMTGLDDGRECYGVSGVDIIDYRECLQGYGSPGFKDPDFIMYCDDDDDDDDDDDGGGGGGMTIPLFDPLFAGMKDKWLGDLHKKMLDPERDTLDEDLMSLLDGLDIEGEKKSHLLQEMKRIVSKDRSEESDED